MVTSAVENHSVPSSPHSPDSLPRGRAHPQVGEAPPPPPLLPICRLLPAPTFFQSSWGQEPPDYISQASQPLPLGSVKGSYGQVIGGLEERRRQVFLLLLPGVASPKARRFPLWSQLMLSSLHFDFFSLS